jgi:subtilisin family serine protease
MVRAQQAWNVTRGAGPKLQIIDTGYFNTVAREDLPVIPGLNCTGLWGCVASEPAGVHGTAIASIIFARDNMVGTVGVAPDMISDSIYVHGCGSSGCDFWQTAHGFSDAVTNRVHVLNASITGPYNLSTANNVALASAEDIVMIAAAGNEFHLSQRYPAAYPEVIGVSGVYENMGFKLYAGPAPCLSSNYGDHVELAAPYFAFAASGSTSGYAEFCGTSGSAALVSGAALLLRAAEPQLNAQQVRERLRATAFHPQGTGLWTQFHGWGIVDAAAAVGLPARPRARIDGPTAIWSSGNYTWTADISGGDGQFSYQWFRHDDHVPCGYIGDEFLVGTAPTYSEPINMQTLDFRLRLVVSSYGVSHSHHIKITVGNGQQPCPMGAPAAAAASPGAG